MSALCSVDECERQALTRGWCQMHYFRWRRNGDPETILTTPRGTMCGIEGCGEKATVRGMCLNHRRRLDKTGDPEGKRDTKGSNNGWWKGDEVEYSGAHLRLRRVRGKATNHVCVCGERAEQWAYTGPRQPGETKPYSTDLSLYSPMCVPCHKTYDLDQIKTDTQ